MRLEAVILRLLAIFLCAVRAALAADSAGNVPRGAPGTFDAGAILGLSSNAIDAGDETWIYYTAINTGHGAPIPPKRITIGRAEWRRHGFASLDAAAEGFVETPPLRFAISTLVVNADASRGEVRAALLEADGRPIAGRTTADCVPLRSDATRWTVRWRDGAPVSIVRPVRVRLELTRAQLFSLSNHP